MKHWINKKTLTAAGIVIAVAWLGVGRPLPSLKNEESAQRIAELAYTKDGKLVPPTFSHESGFYPEAFELTLSHPDPDVTIYYTLDGSDPDPDNLKGSTFRYKNEYAQPPATEPTGEFLYQEYKTYKYTGPIKIVDRTYEPDRMSKISTTTDKSPSYFPKPSLATKEHTNKESRKKYTYKGTQVKSIAVLDNAIASSTSHSILFIGDKNTFDLPIINIATSEKNLFDYDKGILVAGVEFDNYLKSKPKKEYIGRWKANYKLKNDIKATATVFVDKNKTVSLPVKVKVHGGSTRRHANKSIRLYFKNKDSYVANNLFFGSQKKPNSLNALSTVNLRNSGDHFQSDYIGDAANHLIASGLNFPTQRYQPFIVFINGEYNGIKNARDRRDNAFLKNKYALSSKKIDHLSRSRVIKSGSIDNYQKLIDSLSSISKTNYKNLEKNIDIDNFIDYQVFQIFIGNHDWPGNNIAFWRYRDPTNTNKYEDGRWRWLLYDTDASAGYHLPVDFNHLPFAYGKPGTTWRDQPKTASLVLRKALSSDKFKLKFITRFSDLLNSWLKPDRTNLIIKNTEALLTNEMPRHIERWSTPKSIEHWNKSVSDLTAYFSNRPQYQWQHLADFFDLKGLYQVKININKKNSGRIRLNTLNIGDIPNLDHNTTETPLYLPWTGQYFQDLPLTLEAKPALGYQFSHWEIFGAKPGLTKQYKNKIVLKPTGNIHATAIMVKDDVRVSPPVLLQGSNPNSSSFNIKSTGVKKNSASYVEGNFRKSSAARGLTLFGLTENATPTILRNVDTCVAIPRSKQYSFAKDMNKHKTKYGAFAIVAYDTPYCGKQREQLPILFKATGFSQWKNLSFRTPYIAIKNSAGEVQELTGKKETAILAEVRNFITGPADAN